MSSACHVIIDGYKVLSKCSFTEDETKPIGIQITENPAIIVLKWTQWFCSVCTGVPLQIQAGEVLIASLLGYEGVKEDLYLF